MNVKESHWTEQERFETLWIGKDAFSNQKLSIN
jgi:hypothetical protein